VPRTVSLQAYRRLTLVTTVAGAFLFGLGLIVLIQLRIGAVGGPLILVGVLLGLSTALLRIEGQAPATSRGSVVLYARKECVLCDEARALLLPEAARAGVDVWEVDVDADAALSARYGDAVPVCESRGREIFRARVGDVARLRQSLREIAGA